MKIELIKHARERMNKYKISEELVKSTIQNPDSIVEGNFERKIYQKQINKHIIRVIVEENKEIKRVITTYKAGGSRYEI